VFGSPARLDVPLVSPALVGASLAVQGVALQSGCLALSDAATAAILAP
jgi:hypothetical protein